jgi:hypothetical protein
VSATDRVGHCFLLSLGATKSAGGSTSGAGSIHVQIRCQYIPGVPPGPSSHTVRRTPHAHNFWAARHDLTYILPRREGRRHAALVVPLSSGYTATHRALVRFSGHLAKTIAQQYSAPDVPPPSSTVATASPARPGRVSPWIHRRPSQRERKDLHVVYRILLLILVLVFVVMCILFQRSAAVGPPTRYAYESVPTLSQDGLHLV